MKKITKLLSIFLAVVLIVQIVPFSAFAQEPEQELDQEQISVTLPDEGGYVEGLPEELEEEPDSDLESETLEDLFSLETAIWSVSIIQIQVLTLSMKLITALG